VRGELDGEGPDAAGRPEDEDALPGLDASVLTVTTTGVARIIAFRKAGLVEAWGFPGTMPG